MFRKLFPMAALIALVMVLLMSGCSKDCVECPKESPVLYLSKHKINLGATETTSTLAISNKGQQTLSWTISISPSTAAAKLEDSEAGGWLTVSPLTGSGDQTITCTANRSKLNKLGISRATLIINAPDAANTTRDSVEITILQSDAWMIDDDGSLDSCAAPSYDDWFWVKEFHLPPGVDAVIVDSISFYFCSGGEDIQLTAFDWTVMDNDPSRMKFPGQLLSLSGYFETASGWISYPVNWEITTDTFYLGYWQLGSDAPALKIDTSPSDADSTGCWTARDYIPNPDTTVLAWYIEGVSKVFAIRAHIRPAFQYFGKPNAGTSAEELRNTLELGYRQKGMRLTTLCPLRHD
jgi:hypothetical protein